MADHPENPWLYGENEVVITSAAHLRSVMSGKVWVGVHNTGSVVPISQETALRLYRSGTGRSRTRRTMRRDVVLRIAGGKPSGWAGLGVAKLRDSQR